MVKEIKIKSGSWEDIKDTIENALSALKERRVYASNLIYRIIVGGDTSIAKKLIETGAYKKSTNSEGSEFPLKDNEFQGCKEAELAHFYESILANQERFSYIAVYNPEKVREVVPTVYEFNKPLNRKAALESLVEIKYDD